MWKQRGSSGRFIADTLRTLAVTLLAAGVIGVILRHAQSAAAPQQVPRPILLESVVELIQVLGCVTVLLAIGLFMARPDEIQGEAASNTDARRAACEQTILNRCLLAVVALDLPWFLYLPISRYVATPV